VAHCTEHDADDEQRDPAADRIEDADERIEGGAFPLSGPGGYSRIEQESGPHDEEDETERAEAMTPPGMVESGRGLDQRNVHRLQYTQRAASASD